MEKKDTLLLVRRIKMESFRLALKLAGKEKRKDCLSSSHLLRTIGFNIFLICALRSEIKIAHNIYDPIMTNFVVDISLRLS